MQSSLNNLGLKKLSKFLKTPFPKPKRSKKKFFWILLLGIGCSIFILLFNPFDIAAQSGDLYVDLLILSLGIIFSASIIFMEYLVPPMIPKFFSKWTIGKALLWYTLVILFAAVVNFLYKSYLGGFIDFSLPEFFYVLLRTIVISFTVAFALVGVMQFFNKRQISLITSGEEFEINFGDGKSARIDLNNVLYIASNDNYVDLHYLSNNSREKLMIRSSLKNIEEQVVNPVSPILRCHRQYLINFKRFEIEKSSSRNMTLTLKDQEDQVPVSSKYVSAINKVLLSRPI